MAVTWHNKKEDLLRAVTPSPNLALLSRDASKDGTGAKQFAVFPTGQDLVSYITSIPNNKRHFHEIIYDNTNYPCYLYFDMDYDSPTRITQDTYTITINTFLAVLQRFIKDVYEKEVALIIGTNTQVSYTPTTPTHNKLSIHIKINIRFDNTTIMKNFVKNLDLYICSESRVTAAEHAVLYKKQAPIFDLSVYTNFRSYRILTCSKWKTDGLPLESWGVSSHNIEDHLVRVYYDIHQTIIPIEIGHCDYEGNQSNILQLLTSTKISKITPNSNNIQGAEMELSITDDELDHIHSAIASNPDIKAMLKSNENIRMTRTPINTHIVSYGIKGYYCPYAQKVHQKIGSYFLYNSKKKIITYGCHSATCKKTHHNNHIAYEVTLPNDRINRTSLIQTKKSLHCKENIIHWDELYDSEDMNTYPIKPITCIRANMGVGKTKQIIEEFIPTHCYKKETKCLFITYQILLSKKYHANLNKVLEENGFVNYLDVGDKDNRAITNNKIIICLDSLTRVATRNFDFVFIDEVLSVLLHFNSPLMRNVSKVSGLFENLIRHAKYLYVLDACVDNSIVYNFIQYIAYHRGVKPYWIRNKYIRPSNRSATVVINNEKRSESGLRVSMITQVLESLKQNKKELINCCKNKKKLKKSSKKVFRKT